MKYRYHDEHQTIRNKNANGGNAMKNVFASVVLIVTILVSAGTAGKPKVVVVGPPFFLPPVPPLVVISTGISVIPDFDHEVFVLSGFYWTFFDGHWYKSAGPKAKWIKVSIKHVPPGILRLPRGKYLKFKPGKPPGASPHMNKTRKGKGNKGGKGGGKNK
jgi:hypothetical protein